jgi:hypothetical protein
MATCTFFFFRLLNGGCCHLLLSAIHGVSVAGEGQIAMKGT